MPVKRKRMRFRNARVSNEAIARWREIRPQGAELEENCGIIFDNVLADALGIPTLIWLEEAAAALRQLEENA